MSAQFSQTRWTLVRRASQDGDAGAAALSELCKIYYVPVCNFFARWAGDRDAGQDDAHAFFEELLVRPTPIGAEQSEGRFRSYLLGAAKHFLSRKRAYDGAEKRGGNVLQVSFEEESQALAGGEADAHSFDRDWALAVIASSLAKLESEMEEAGKGDHYRHLKPWLLPDGKREYSHIAAELGMEEAAARVAVHRLRQRYRECLHQQIYDTVGSDSDLKAELDYLILILS